MMTDVYRLPLNAKVRLRGDRTNVYTLAKAGAEGWIRKHEQDPVGGYPMVFIEWDTDHWAYNHQDNMWTYEDHFDLIEGPVKENNEELTKILAELTRVLTQNSGKPETTEDVQDPPQADHQFEVIEGGKSDKPSFDEELQKAFEYAKGSDGFLVVAVANERNPVTGQGTVAIPHVFKSEKTEVAEVLIGVQLSALASLFHQELGYDRLQEIFGPDVA